MLFGGADNANCTYKRTNMGGVGGGGGGGVVYPYFPQIYETLYQKSI